MKAIIFQYIYEALVRDCIEGLHKIHIDDVKTATSIYDLNATLLHLLGLDHTRLTFRHQGRDFRLTDVHGEVIKPILA